MQENFFQMQEEKNSLSFT